MRLHPRHEHWHHHDHQRSWLHRHRAWHEARLAQLGVRGYVRARMHRRIFLWFALTVVLSVAAAALAMNLSNGPIVQGQLERLSTFVAHQFEPVWDTPARRDALAAEFTRDLALDITLRDAAGNVLQAFGRPCLEPVFASTVRASSSTGLVEVCVDRSHFHGGRAGAFLTLFAIVVVLWAMSGKLARRIARPIVELSEVTRDIGAGRLQSRARLAWHAPGEIGLLAESVNDMASRIERQIQDQRELLAGVSHELRTPLARVRLLVELLRGEGRDHKRLDDIEREMVEMDALVGELLASSKLDFSQIDRRPIDAADAARKALERRGLPLERAVTEGVQASVDADPALLARALANLIENAERHGGGLVALRVTETDDGISFAAEDAGSGFPEGAEKQLFQPFAPRPDGRPRGEGSLGLGLSLVRRIAVAHGGRVFAENRAEGGARVGVVLPESLG